MTVEQAKQHYTETMAKVDALDYATSLLHWDMDTIAPKKGQAVRGETIARLSGEVFALTTSEAYGQTLDALWENADRLDSILHRSVAVARRDYEKDKKIPQDLFEAYTLAQSASNNAWKEAKAQNDFALFRPHLEKLIGFSKQFVELWGFEGHPYNALLDNYEEGMTVELLDGIFPPLRDATAALVGKIGAKEPPIKPIISAGKQEQIGHYLLRTIGYDLEAGNLFTTEHPFESRIHPHDVRVTTHYYEENPFSSLFSVLHEGGHGMYEQNVSDDLPGNLHSGASLGIHESQSRFWENMIGRSRAFWETQFTPLSAIAGVGLGTDAEDAFRTANHTAPSLIRIEADELTYNLHVIIRYELEKAIFSGDIAVDDLPGLWNEKYLEYLGVSADTSAQGILQDMHWSAGYFGYFPTYSLGNLYGAQFAVTLQKELGSLDSLIRAQGGFSKIRDWLTEKIYRYGKLETPSQILQRVTGEPLNSRYFIDYITAKMADLYGI